MILSDLGDHTHALDLFHEALGVFDSHRATLDPVQEATCLGAVGIACTQLGEFAQAEDAYLRALEAYRGVRNAEGMGYLYNNLAILRVRAIQALPERGDAAAPLARELFEFIDQGLDLDERSIHSAHLRALLLNTKGDGLRALGRAAEALPMIERALDTYREMNSPRGEADAAADLGAALIELGRVDEALARLQTGLDVAVAHELKDHQRRLRRLLSDALEKSGDHREALAQYKTYHRLERELSDRDTQKKLQQLALREEIGKALSEARAQSRRSAELFEQNEALRRQTEALDRIAYVDALTGLPNRRRFEERAAALPEQLPETFAVAVLDIDFFKRINDTWSHAMGDTVLQAVGMLLHSHCREEDLVARIGGEEFVLVLSGISPGQAMEACERVRAGIEAHPWSSVQAGMNVTISIGLAVADGKSALGDLLKTADARLYAAKRGGRNRVVSD
jgi:diguanylate cyclase (GGDEF)-like protein